MEMIKNPFKTLELDTCGGGVEPGLLASRLLSLPAAHLRQP